MICINDNCPIADNCWTYGKPPDNSEQRKEIIPEQDDDQGFECKAFQNVTETGE